MTENHEKENAFERLERFSQALDSGMFVRVRNMLNVLPPSDIAHVLESAVPRTRKILWRLLKDELTGDVLQNLSDEVRADIIQGMEAEQLAQAASGLDTDDLADILGELPEQIYQQVVSNLDDTDRHRVETALAYSEDTAGGLMNTDTITVRTDVTIEVVLRYMRMKGSLPRTTDRLYVVDDNNKFIGTLAISAILTSPTNKMVADVMVEDVEAIAADMSDTEVAQLFERYDLVTAPVVNTEGELLGRITIDDVVDVIREGADHSLMSMAGLDEEEDTFAPIFRTTSRRAFWLGINLITAIVAASVITPFKHTIENFVALAVLMPIVANMGGIAGTQSLTLVIRGMTLGQIGRSNIVWLLNREFLVSLFNGILWAICLGVLTIFWLEADVRIAYVVVAAMLINLVAGALSGAALPMILKARNIDPALAGGVILTTITDAVGFLSLLGLATLVLT